MLQTRLTQEGQNNIESVPVSISEPTNVQALSIDGTLSITLSALTEYTFQCLSSLVHSFATSTFYLFPLQKVNFVLEILLHLDGSLTDVVH